MRVRVRQGDVVTVAFVPSGTGTAVAVTFTFVVRVRVPARDFAALYALSCASALPPAVVLVLVLILLSASLDGAFVVRVEPDSCAGLASDTTSFFSVTAGAGGGGFFEEEVEQFVVDGEVGCLLKLLEGGEAEEGFEEGEGGADVGEG